jgi:hypothetical protein
MSDDIDEVALNALIASGIDPATAFVAAERTEPPRPGQPNRWSSFGLLVGVLIGALLMWLLN